MLSNTDNGLSKLSTLMLAGSLVALCSVVRTQTLDSERDEKVSTYRQIVGQAWKADQGKGLSTIIPLGKTYVSDVQHL